MRRTEFPDVSAKSIIAAVLFLACLSACTTSGNWADGVSISPDWDEIFEFWGDMDDLLSSPEEYLVYGVPDAVLTRSSDRYPKVPPDSITIYTSELFVPSGYARVAALTIYPVGQDTAALLAAAVRLASKRGANAVVLGETRTRRRPEHRTRSRWGFPEKENPLQLNGQVLAIRQVDMNANWTMHFRVNLSWLTKRHAGQCRYTLRMTTPPFFAVADSLKPLVRYELSGTIDTTGTFTDSTQIVFTTESPAASIRYKLSAREWADSGRTNVASAC